VCLVSVPLKLGRQKSGRNEEVQEVRENDIPVSRSEKHHYAGPPRCPFGTMGREAELADETR